MADKQLKVGDPIPRGIFKYVPWTDKLEDKLTCGIPIELSTDEWKNKKVVLVSVPGAFTPTCHSKHLPPYLSHYDDLKKKGVDVVAVIAANDAFVMSAWARDQGFKDKILAISDPNVAWAKEAGITKDLTGAGMGMRIARTAMIINNLKIEYLGIDRGDVKESGVDAVLASLP